MTYKKYIFIMLLTAAIGWTSLVLVITKLDPCTAPGMITICHSLSGFSLVLFFLSAAVACAGSFTLLGFALRLWLNHYEIYIDHLNVSLRQGVLLTLCSLAALALLPLRALTWWTGLLLIGVIILFELYFSRE